MYYVISSLIISTFTMGCGMFLLNKSVKFSTVYRKWNRLKMLTKSTEQDTLMIYYISLKLIAKYIYICIYQYLNSTVKIINNDIYEVTYVILDQEYKMIVKPRRGPKPILQIIADDKDDVTDQIIPYVGPNYNWHGTSIKPRFFKYEKLTFEYSDGNSQVLIN